MVLGNIDAATAGARRYAKALARRACPAALGQQAYQSGLLQLQAVLRRNVGQWPLVFWKDVAPRALPDTERAVSKGRVELLGPVNGSSRVEHVLFSVCVP